jgi:hypothetical protein
LIHHSHCFISCIPAHLELALRLSSLASFSTKARHKVLQALYLSGLRGCCCCCKRGTLLALLQELGVAANVVVQPATAHLQILQNAKVA